MDRIIVKFSDLEDCKRIQQKLIADGCRWYEGGATATGRSIKTPSDEDALCVTHEGTIMWAYYEAEKRYFVDHTGSY